MSSKNTEYSTKKLFYFKKSTDSRSVNISIDLHELLFQK